MARDNSLNDQKDSLSELNWKEMDEWDLEEWLSDRENKGKIGFDTIKEMMDVWGKNKNIKALLLHHMDSETLIKMLPSLSIGNKGNESERVFEILDSWLKSNAKTTDLEFLKKNILPLFGDDKEKCYVVVAWLQHSERYDSDKSPLEINYLKELLTFFDDNMKVNLIYVLMKDEDFSLSASDNLWGDNLAFLKEILALLDNDHDKDRTRQKIEMIIGFFISNPKNINLEIFQETLTLLDDQDDKLRAAGRGILVLKDHSKRIHFFSQIINAGLIGNNFTDICNYIIPNDLKRDPHGNIADFIIEYYFTKISPEARLIFNKFPILQEH